MVDVNKDLYDTFESIQIYVGVERVCEITNEDGKYVRVFDTEETLYIEAVISDCKRIHKIYKSKIAFTIQNINQTSRQTQFEIFLTE